MPITCTQDPVPCKQLDTDALLLEGPVEILLDCVSPIAVELSAYRSAPDWQRGPPGTVTNPWFPLVGGVVSVRGAHMHARRTHGRSGTHIHARRTCTAAHTCTPQAHCMHTHAIHTSTKPHIRASRTYARSDAHMHAAYTRNECIYTPYIHTPQTHLMPCRFGWSTSTERTL